MNPKPDEPKRSPLVKAGVFAALGTEFVAFTLVGVYGGIWVDERFDTAPFGLLACLILTLLAAGIHTVQISKRFME